MTSDIDYVASFSDDSSSDDDQYLLSYVGDEDREAIIRRKLLESFYGTTDTASPTMNKPSDPEQQVSEDLDASNFSANAYAKRRIHTNSTRDLLSSTNELSQSIRLLDSTMQTLVYENYSKFISATDAIRSIGQSVHVSHEQLQTLQKKIEKVETNTFKLENSLNEKRKEVVEKLKLQRLLNRLKSLVELPSTLKELYSKEKYHCMTKDYVDAMIILNRHSGFESLQNIQVECTTIVESMIQEVGKMLYMWCGGIGGGGVARTKRANKFSTKSGIPSTLEKIWLSAGQFAKVGYETNISTPNDVGNIFECVGALFLYKKYYDGDLQDFDEEGKKNLDPTPNDTLSILREYTVHDFLILALESCTRIFERLLEDHEIEVHEMDTSGDVVTLFPPKYLPSILEAATSVSSTFGNQDSNRAILTEYISLIWFPDFIAHVKRMIDCFSSHSHSITTDSADKAISNDEFKSFSAISLDMMNVVRSVREMANGLVLPDVGVNADIASALVEETVGVKDSLIRTRVTKKFKHLRLRVLKECLSPFVRSVLRDALFDDHQQLILRSVQKASSKLSEIMQIIDDTIQSILMNDNSDGDELNTLSFDLAMVDEALTYNCREFVFWLASSLEVISGSESSIGDATLNAKPVVDTDSDDDRNPKRKLICTCAELRQAYEEHNFVSDTEKDILFALKDETVETDGWESCDVLLLALIQMCRLCERNLVASMSQSISSSLLDSPFTQNDFTYRFKNTDTSVDSDGMLSSRLLLAASRCLSVYVTIKGHDATSSACHDLQSSSLIESDFFPHSPSDAAIKVLEVAKQICLECKVALGTDLKASDLPDFGSDYRHDSMSLSSGSRFSTGHSTIKGLSLDVARIFTQQVQIYQGSFDLCDFTRDAILSSALQIGIKAWSESLRFCSLTTHAYRQMQVDEEFLKYMLPHYLSESTVSDVTKVLDEFMMNAGDRCIDSRCVGVKEYFDEVRGKILSPLSIALGWLKEEDAAGGRGVLNQFVLREEMIEKDE